MLLAGGSDGFLAGTGFLAGNGFSGLEGGVFNAHKMIDRIQQ